MAATDEKDEIRSGPVRINRESLLISKPEEASELIRNAQSASADDVPSMKLSTAARLIRDAFLGRKWTKSIDLE